MRWLPAGVGVAYVASSVNLEGSRIHVVPRANALFVRSNTLIIPVVHVDASWREPPELNATQRKILVDQVLKVARRAAEQNAARVVQLDFEARLSQRAFLTDVVKDIRAQLPAAMALSMTALASWCAGDYWLATIHADEVVPMVFRMGRDADRLRTQFATDNGFKRARCSTAIGFASDEPGLAQVAGQGVRRYFFSPLAWTPDIWRGLPMPSPISR